MPSDGVLSNARTRRRVGNALAKLRMSTGPAQLGVRNVKDSSGQIVEMMIDVGIRFIKRVYGLGGDVRSNPTHGPHAGDGPRDGKKTSVGCIRNEEVGAWRPGAARILRGKSTAAHRQD